MFPRFSQLAFENGIIFTIFMLQYEMGEYICYLYKISIKEVEKGRILL